ncbi:MAG: hypothetical protein JXR96_05020 [Deltaproteobacteria bacterium]|nr:hypothetical protein [Deltaproteobacteria bacterium]
MRGIEPRQVRIPAACVLGLLWLLASCERPQEKSQEDLTIVVEADRSALTVEEKELARKQEQFEKEMEALRKEQDELLAEKTRLQKEDVEKLRELQRKRRDLEGRETTMEQERRQLDKRKSEILDSLMKGQGAPGASQASNEMALARRESAVAGREKAVSSREKDLQEREQKIVKLEERLAALLVELTEKAKSMPTRVVTMPPSAPGGRVTRKQAEAAYKSATKRMNAKGILWADLPAEMTGLRKEIEQARRKRNNQRVLDLVEQLDAAVAATVVDEGFIKRKFDRLNGLSRSKPPGDPASKKKVQALLRKSIQLVGDGQYDQANRELNRIYGLLR